jgi:hypothetical protein
VVGWDGVFSSFLSFLSLSFLSFSFDLDGEESGLVVVVVLDPPDAFGFDDADGLSPEPPDAFAVVAALAVAFGAALLAVGLDEDFSYQSSSDSSSAISCVRW